MQRKIEKPSFKVTMARSIVDLVDLFSIQNFRKIRKQIFFISKALEEWNKFNLIKTH